MRIRAKKSPCIAQATETEAEIRRQNVRSYQFGHITDTLVLSCILGGKTLFASIRGVARIDSTKMNDVNDQK